ncbi:MAG: type II toxin-antitoxin system VapC family toxin [SAR324 cluster bacterium]|nr:type II toxin-antitoxin system VapC family toxin [SAR324 cluster bacterium]
MTRFAVDTNLLVYAHNISSEFHEKARVFIEKVMNQKDEDGKLSLVMPTQVLMEFLHVITWQKLENPISLPIAIDVVQSYLDTGVQVIHQKDNQMETTLEILKTLTTRKRMFDVALAATLKNNGIDGLYTVNTKDFEGFEFLTVVNPLV